MLVRGTLQRPLAELKCGKTARPNTANQEVLVGGLTFKVCTIYWYAL